MHVDNESKNEVLRKALTEIRDLKEKLSSKEKLIEPIAIIGIGCKLPGGIKNPEDLWKALINQENMISSVEESRWSKYPKEYIENNPYMKKAGFLKEDALAFDNKFFRISPKEAERIDPQQRLFLKVAWEALEDSGYSPTSLKQSKTGVYAGVTLSDYGNKLALYRNAKNEIEPGDVMGSNFSFLSGRVSYFLGLQGPSITVDTACSASLVAIDTACKGLITGDCDMAIAGGVNVMYSPETTELFGALNILSPDCEIRTFDAKANGTVRGEGCGIVILKRLKDAEKDRDFIYAVIDGSGTNQDGPSSGLTAPYGPSQEKLVKDVLRKSGVDPKDVGYIETHGTGTELGDPIEISALGNVFSVHKESPLYVGTVKTNIGHLEAAAGVAGLIKATLCVKNGQIPGNLNFETPSPHIEWDKLPVEVPKKTIPWQTYGGKKRIAGVSSFGLSGTNAHVIVEQYIEKAKNKGQKDEKIKDKNWPFKFSSNTEKGLANQIKVFSEYLEENEISEDLLSSLSYSQNISKGDLKEKAVIWANSLDGLKENISLVLNGMGNENIKLGNHEKKIVFLFTGQGSQYPSMLREFYNDNNIFKYWMDKCNKCYEEYTGESLLKIIFNSGNEINETKFTQPALFSVEYSLSRMWMEYGINPSIMIGHSIGEYVAATLAGVFKLKDAINMVTARGKYMDELSERSKMAAIFIERDKVEKLLKDKKLVSIAATNTPNQTIISGDEEEVDHICRGLNDKGIKTVFLKVSHGFHSPLMKGMLKKFEEVTKKVDFHIPSKTIISNITGMPIREEIANWKYWSNHILSEVKFYDSIKAISNIENYAFLEIGPTPVLSAFVDKICGDKVQIVISNYPNTNTVDQVENGIFELYTLGANVNWRKYYRDKGLKKIFTPNYRFDEKHFELKELDFVDGDNFKNSRVNNNLSYELEEDNEYEFSFNLKNKKYSFKTLEETITYVRGELVRELKIENEDLLNDENLILCGLNSIITTKLVSVWKKRLGVTLKPSNLIQDPTINKWAEILYDKSNVQDKDEDSVEFIQHPDKKYESFKLSKVQDAYWFGRNPEVMWGGVSCYASYEIDVENIDVKRFENAVKSVVRRHDMLRNIISEDGTQRVREDIEIPLVIYRKNNIVNLKEHLEKIRKEISIQVIPLGKPMFDIRLTELNNEKWKIHFGIDFMIADALSLSILWRDISYYYKGKELSNLEVTYKDYLNYEIKRNSTEAYDLDKKYWLNKIEGFPDSPELPINILKDKKPKFVRRKKWLDLETWNNFVRLSAKNKLTPSAALLSLYSEVISAWGAGRAFAIMLTVFNREAVHPQINDVIGDFTQLALVEIQRKDKAAFENARNIQCQMQKDIEHSNYSAIDFMKELNKVEGSRQRIYPVVFTSALGMDSLNNGDEFNVFGKNMEGIASSTPQVWLDHQVFNEKGGIALNWDSLDDMFFPGVIQDMFDKYVELVIKASKDEGFWEKKLTDLRTKKHKEVQNKVNSTVANIKDMTLHEGIRYKAFLNGDKTALVFKDRKYSYRDIIHRAHQTSQLLQQHGVKKGEKVAVQMKKSFDQIAVVLGIVQIGAVYVPMTYDQPLNRTKDIIEKAEISIIFKDELQEGFEDKVTQILPKNLDDLSGIWDEVKVFPEDLAYVIYTSGSTGTPKGVCIEHKASMNTISDVNNKLKVTEKDSILGISSLSFDLSVYDIFGVLSAGGTLVLPTEEERIDPKCWKMLSDKNKITLWNSVPALMEIYVDYIISLGNNEKQNSLRHIILSGDWIPLTLPDKIKKVLPNAKLTSMGGATEASIWSNYYDVIDIKREWKSIPYGYPLSNQSFYILDDFNRPCPQWVKGRLFIGGKGIATGYLNETELTNEAFINHKAINKRLYNTGDYGRYIEGGIIEFLGRKDNQMKINGYRIEIGEIQSAFKKCGNLGDAMILPVGDKDDKKKIVGYVKSSESPYSEAEWKVKLKEHLPNYFIPEKIFLIEEYPITPNGKVDRKALLKIYEEKADEVKIIDSNNSLDHHPVLRTVRQVLNMPDLNSNDNFGDIGVSSVDIIRLANNLETIYGERPSVGEMVKYKFISELLKFYENLNINLREDMSEEDKEIALSKQEVASENKIHEDEWKSNIKEFNKMKDLEESCTKKRIELWTEDGKLKFKAPEGAMTSEIRNDLKNNKENLILYLEERRKKREKELIIKKNNQFPLTPLQLAYVLGRSKDYELGNVSAHYYSEYECEKIDRERFEKAINDVIKKNEMLRCIVYENGIQEVLQEIPTYKVKVNEVNCEDDLENIRNRWSKHHYHLGKWPMFNIEISQLKNNISRIHFSFDCLIVDGWSTHLLFKEIFKSYYGMEINEPEITMREYIKRQEKWLQHKDYHKKAEEYWNDRVYKLPSAPMLPIKKDFSLIEKPNFLRKKFTLTKEDTARFKNQMKKNHFTSSAVICTAYMKVMSHWSREKDITLNLTLFNRLPLSKDVMNILGDFTNITLVPYMYNPKFTINEEIENIQTLLWEAVAHRTYNGLNLLKTLSKNVPGKAVMPIVFTSLLFGETGEEDDNVLNNMKEIYAISQTPQVALDHQAYERNGQITFIWDYVDEAFEEEVIDEMFQDFIALIKELVNEDQWNEKIDISLLKS